MHLNPLFLFLYLLALYLSFIIFTMKFLTVPTFAFFNFCLTVRSDVSFFDFKSDIRFQNRISDFDFERNRISDSSISDFKIGFSQNKTSSSGCDTSLQHMDIREFLKLDNNSWCFRQIRTNMVGISRRQQRKRLLDKQL